VSFEEFLVVLLTAINKEKGKHLKDKAYKVLKENISPLIGRS